MGIPLFQQLPSSDNEMYDGPYAKQWDYVDNLIYVGTAPPGTPTSAATWAICRMTCSTAGAAPTAIEWANGNARHQNIWDNHASLTYS
jgi:hypothetical protein